MTNTPKVSEMIGKRTAFFESTPPEVFSQIADSQLQVRNKALNALIKPLNEESSDDILLFQTMPLGFLEKGDTIGAIWYIETVGRSGKVIPWEIIERVYEQAIIDKDMFFLYEDKENDRVVSKSLDALFRMLRMHDLYKDKIELLIIQGDYEEVKEKPSTAISFYEQAMERGSIAGYIACANIYEERGDYDQSLRILEEGWFKYHDTDILSKLVSILCRAERTSEALERYEELNRLNKGKTDPFLVYKGYVENDGELRLFEEFISEYITKGKFIPSEGLETLAATAIYYIERSVQEEDEKIKVLSNKSLEDWTNQDFDILKRRLWLIQTDILTLGNGRYLEVYLADLKKLGTEGDSYTRDILQDFFMEHFSKEVEYRGGEGEKSIANYTEISVFQNIWLHANRIAELFSSGDSYVFIKDTITPLLVDCEKLGVFYDEEIDLERIQSLVSLKRIHDYYNTLRPDTREDYEVFLHEFDEKYGTYYRRHIQHLVTTLSIIPRGYPLAFKEYPEIAFLFWMEKILKGGMHTDDPEEIEKIVVKYSLYEIGISNALLFGEVIQKISVEYAITFLVNYPRMLQIPKALYIITECLRNINPEIREHTLSDLDGFVVDNYGAENFFGHIDAIFDAIDTDNPTEENLHYMLLTNGNIAILQRKEKIESIIDSSHTSIEGLSQTPESYGHIGKYDQALMNFHTASELGSLEGSLQAAELHENRGEYDKALVFFEKAVCFDDTESVIKSILNCSIRMARFDVAQKYIELGMAKGYNIRNQILAFHLWQGNTRDAFLQVISMMGDGEMIVDVPKGLIQLLLSTKVSVLSKKDTTPGDIELTILASYIETILMLDDKSEVNPNHFMKHWQYVVSLPDFYTGEALYQQIKQCLEPIVGVIDPSGDISARASDSDEEELTLQEELAVIRNMHIDAIPLSSGDISVNLLEIHAQRIYKTFQKLLNSAMEAKDIEKQEELFVIMDKFCYMNISLLQRLPDTGEFVMGWRDNIHLHLFDYTSNKMPHTVQ